MADARPNWATLSGDTVTLDGTASADSDGSVIGHEWVQVSGTAVTLSDPYAATTTFTAPEVKGKGEDLVFELTVMDDVGATGTD